MTGIHQLVVKLLYGSGLRIIECLRLRVHDIDFDMKALTVRSGKGDKARVTTGIWMGTWGTGGVTLTIWIYLRSF